MDDSPQATGLDQTAGDDTVTLARTAAEAIRGLNHATGCDAGLGQPAVVYDILGALSLAASRLPQLLVQITGYLDRALAAGQLGHDLGEDPTPAVDAAATFVQDARGSAALAGDLDAAQQQLRPVNGQLESVRMLTNHDMDSRTPFATVLIGQPTLRRMIKFGVLAALDQRIAVRYHLSGMTADETGGYIRHHLQLAGRDSDLYSEDAITQIHEAGRGKPRAVNNICVAALIAAYVTGKKIVDQTAARAAVSEVTSSE